MSDDPRLELDALTHALGALVRRRSALGQRTTARPPALAPSSAPAPAPTSGRAPAPVPVPRQAPSPRPASVDSDPPKPAQRQIEPVPARTKAPGLKSAAARVVERATAEVAARAAACSDLEALRAEVAACRACALCDSRKQTVFAAGRGQARVLFIGEAPGFHEDQQGVPFVGPAGELLGDIIKAMGLTRDEVYIANVLKCRPPENRDPSEHEKRLCTPFLDRQIELVEPGVIIPLGRHAACHVLGVQASMGSLRGRVHLMEGRKIVPTFHPAYLLRSPGKKQDCWQDIQLAMEVLGLQPPPRRSRAERGAPDPRPDDQRSGQGG